MALPSSLRTISGNWRTAAIAAGSKIAGFTKQLSYIWDILSRTHTRVPRMGHPSADRLPDCRQTGSYRLSGAL
jgi:hypothetical protein